MIELEDKEEGEDSIPSISTDAVERISKQRMFCGYPLSVTFIFGNELCERFSFYGLRAVLFLYLNEFLGFSNDRATSIFHAFIFFSYFFPLVGAVLSDAYLGKFRTIASLSFVYCAGSIVLSVTSIPGVTGHPPHWWGMILGLLLIALGTGGIKPCVSSFGGDQFQRDQEELLSSFFAFFYLSINLGSTVSIFITPILRKEVGFWLAFGLPAILLLTATTIFLLGSSWYRKVPPGENVIGTFFGVIKTALVEKFKNNSRPVQHWLDRSDGFYPSHVVNDVKSVVAILVAFVPLPMFWALFDQSASRWVAQAREMDGKLGSWEITADQTNTFNPLFVIVLVPVFDKLIYPYLRRHSINIRPLRRMKYGMIFTSLSFVTAALVEIILQSTKVHRLWQAVQFLLLSIGEILVSVSGLEFAYSQAPASMKSVIMALWLCTNAIGNAFVAFVAEFSMNQIAEYFMYAFFMICFLLLFIFLTRNYKYVEDMKSNEVISRGRRGSEYDTSALASLIREDI